MRGGQEYIEQPICTVNGQQLMKKYRKLKSVGQGSYSKCWLVRTQGSDSQYVVKVMAKGKLELLVKEKLVYQIRIHQQLSHQHVVHLDHWFQDNKNQYIFLQYCPEGNLQKLLQLKGHFQEKEIRRYVRQIVQAIAYIHSKLILHRDLKLCNFYLDAHQNIKLGDFGFACQLAHPNELKRETCGTPNYIAPEAISGFGYSFSSDVWSVGVILYRLKFRACPFEGATVKETLQKVKTCQYSFPNAKKISSQLKDLIRKIFTINYDERLTLDQILDHPFFGGQQRPSQPVPQHSQSEAKTGSIFRNLFSRQKPSQPQPQRGRTKEMASNAPKRSNSCETSKQIKEILKNKSKGTLATNMNTTQFRTEEGTMGLMTQGRQRTLLGNTTIRSMADTSLNMSIIQRKLDTQPRVNNFLGNVKEQLRVGGKGAMGSKVALGGQQQLSQIARKYYLPYAVQCEKDVLLIHYKDSIKQVLWGGKSLIVHRQKQPLFDMRGQPFLNVPKVIQYILQRNLQISQAQPEEEQYGSYSIQKILLFVSHKNLIVKDGVVLWLGTGGIFAAKMYSNQMLYLGSASKEGGRWREDGKVSLLYAREGQHYKAAEGVVFVKLYQGWLANLFRHAKQ